MIGPRSLTRATFALVPAAVGALLLASACGQESLETQTFELQFLDPEEAVEMVTPYVYDDRPDAPGLVTHFADGITVRETPDNLERIGRVLGEYDRAKPAVRLHFQLIEANGREGTDPRIADIEAALRELFRFDGYELIAEAPMGAMEGSGSSMVLQSSMQEFFLMAEVHGVRGSSSAGAVSLNVTLRGSLAGEIGTSMTVPVGETVVLGSTQPAHGGAIILTVRPELVELPR